MSNNPTLSSKEIDVITAWMQTQWERIPATPHSQPGSYARGYDGGMVDILRGLQATLDKLPPAHETRAFPQAPETDERYNVSDGLLETLIEVAQDNGFRDVVEALRELQVRRGRSSEKASE